MPTCPSRVRHWAQLSRYDQCFPRFKASLRRHAIHASLRYRFSDACRKRAPSGSRTSATWRRRFARPHVRVATRHVADSRRMRMSIWTTLGIPRRSAGNGRCSSKRAALCQIAGKRLFFGSLLERSNPAFRSLGSNPCLSATRNEQASCQAAGSDLRSSKIPLTIPR